MSVTREYVRLVGDVIGYARRIRRPGLVLFVIAVGVIAVLALLAGVIAPVAIYPLL